MTGRIAGQGSARRRRRSQAEAEAEILDAAEAFLAERPWHDLTVEHVMERTTMTRNAFYHYFDDRRALLVRLMAHVGDQLTAITERWLSGEGNHYEDAVVTLTGTAEIYRRHGSLIRAASEAAAADGQINRLREQIFDGFVTATARWIQRAQTAGAIPSLDPETSPKQLAEALVAMGDAYMTRRYGWGTTGPPVRTVARTLLQVWIGALYRMSPQQLKETESRSA